MAQTRPRRIEPRATTPAQSRRFSVEWVALFVTLLAGGIPFAIGKYMEFSMPGPFDSGAYVYAAESMLQGRHLGTEVSVSAQPATLLINLVGVWLFGFNETGPKLIQMLMQLGALAMMYNVLRRLYGLPAAVVGVSMAAIFLSAPLIAKYGNVKEQFMIAVMVMAICCFVLYRLDGGWWKAILTGVFLINAFYFKATGASATGAVLGFLVLRTALRRDSIRSFGKDFILILTGALLGLIPLSIFFAAQGQFRMFQSTFPVMTVKFAILLTLLAGIIMAIATRSVRDRLWRPFRRVQPVLWKVGAILIVLAIGLAFGMVYRAAYSAGETGWGDSLQSFVRDHPLAFLPVSIWNKGAAIWKWVVWTTSGGATYVGAGRAVWSFEKQMPIVFRYYGALKLPILFAILSLLAALGGWILGRKKTTKRPLEPSLENRIRAVGTQVTLLFAIWWILDMSFVWISPRAFEEYYLPLNASAAMAGGYLLGWYRDRFRTAEFKVPWVAGGAIAGFVAVIMVWPIFAGLSVSPYSGKPYEQPARGYAQRLEEVRQRRLYQPPWERVAQVIREQSRPGDGIFVWGWYPGIYVQAQRLSPARKAFESDMHVMSPQKLFSEITWLLIDLSRLKPVFIVDSRKSEFPWDRRPLELWPTMQDGRLIPNQPSAIAEYDTAYRKFLRDTIGEDEMLRYDAMERFRKFIRENYEVVNDPSFTPQHVLFRLKSAGSSPSAPRTP